MTDPFDPYSPNDPYDHRDRRDHRDPDDVLERELRRSLARQADQAPDASALTERLLGAASSAGRADHDPWTRRRGWSTWGTPLIAAACVALIAAIVLAVVRPGQEHDTPDAVGTPTHAKTALVPVSTAPVSPTAAPSSSTETTTSNGAAIVLENVRVLDLTFTRQDVGWALASADCLKGTGRCTALLRTTDGTRWGTTPNSTPFDVPGVRAGCPASSCVTHIRFADDSVGYAFGPDALYLTEDGAQTWTKLSGGADALETLNNNVIRVSAIDTAKPSLQTGALGGTSWTSHSTAAFPADPVGVTLSRSGNAAVLAFTRFDPAKGSGIGQSGVLLRSSNDGASWQSSGDPCPSRGDGFTNVLTTATLSLDGAVVADCAGRSTTNSSLLAGQTITSTNGGATFDAPSAGGKLAPAAVLGAPSRQVQLVVPTGSTGLYRSTDRGNSWKQVQGVAAANVRFLGFEGATVGRLVTDDGRTIWTTRDAGAHWTKVSF